MFILRKISGSGVEMNFNLGDSYTLITKEHNEKEFNEMAEKNKAMKDFVKTFGKFDLVIADPPYSDDESKEIYNINTPLKYSKWTAEAEKLLKPGGLLVVYHKYQMPNPNPLKFSVVKRVAIFSRSYHLLRAVIYFKKKGKLK